MRILVNQKPVEQLSKGELKDLTRSKPGALVTGVVLTGEVATARVMRTRAIVFGVLAVFALAVIGGIMVGVILDGPSFDQSNILVACVVGLVVVAAILRWGYRRTARLWLSRLPERVAAMPQPGTEVKLDDDGISVGATTARWSQLRIELLEAIVASNGKYSTLIAERLILAGGPEPITLDINLIEHGRQIVDIACGRLLPTGI